MKKTVSNQHRCDLLIHIKLFGMLSKKTKKKKIPLLRWCNPPVKWSDTILICMKCVRIDVLCWNFQRSNLILAWKKRWNKRNENGHKWRFYVTTTKKNNRHQIKMRNLSMTESVASIDPFGWLVSCFVYCCKHGRLMNHWMHLYLVALVLILSIVSFLGQLLMRITRRISLISSLYLSQLRSDYIYVDLIFHWLNIVTVR